MWRCTAHASSGLAIRSSVRVTPCAGSGLPGGCAGAIGAVTLSSNVPATDDGRWLTWIRYVVPFDGDEAGRRVAVVVRGVAADADELRAHLLEDVDDDVEVAVGGQRRRRPAVGRRRRRVPDGRADGAAALGGVTGPARRADRRPGDRRRQRVQRRGVGAVVVGGSGGASGGRHDEQRQQAADAIRTRIGPTIRRAADASRNQARLRPVSVRFAPLRRGRADRRASAHAPADRGARW